MHTGAHEVSAEQGRFLTGIPWGRASMRFSTSLGDVYDILL